MGEDAKEKGMRKVGGAGKRKRKALPSFLPFYFRVCAFLIQRTRLSWSLEQSIGNWTVLAPIKTAKLNPKIRTAFTHRKGPIFRAKTDLFYLQCSYHP